MKATRRPRTILFLIADTGAGHRSAANALHNALRALDQPPPAHSRASTHAQPGWHAVIVDVFAEYGRFPVRNGVFLYGPAIKYSPRLYGHLFHITNSAVRFNTAWHLFQPFLRQGLRRLIERTRPDVIVSIHPLLNHITVEALRDMGMHIPFLTVVTDLVSIHCAWIARGVDACVVPTEAARDYAIRAGLSAKRVHLLGMPIDPKFAAEPAGTREELRTALGLDPHLPTILLVGGGEGAGGLTEAVMALGEEALPAQLLVVTGRNRQLYAELQQLRDEFRTPVQVHGFVNNMPDLMRASDIVVTKAGPGTISEAMACELPILLTGAVPGQEEGNVDYVLDNGVGMLATTPGDLVNAVRELLDPTSSRLAALHENARKLGHARASFDIARMIMSYLPAGNAPSLWDSVSRPAHRRATRPLIRPPRLASGFAVISAGTKGLRRPVLQLTRFRAAQNGLSRYRMPGLANLAGVRDRLRGEHSEKVQLRRPGSGRRRHDARPPLSGGRR